MPIASWMFCALTLLATAGRTFAADAALPGKAPPIPHVYDWTGLYVGGHFGYAGGKSDWTAQSTGAPGPALSGALDLFLPYDIFKGTGSYFAGFQAGYNVMLPSHFLLGVEADVSFPNSIGGAQMISSASIGEASFSEKVLMSGTARARLGYAFGQWLVYGTGGFAWSYDQVSRQQVAGAPAGGVAEPDTAEFARLWRYGWAAGAGIEVPLVPGWTAKAEYLYSGFGSGTVTFPAGAQQFDSSLSRHDLRLGMNYKFSGDVKASAGAIVPTAPETDIFSVHGQTTLLGQYDFPFRAPYRGQNSLDPNHGRETWDVTLYAGLRLWQGAELWVNPEIDQGFGLSGTLGAAGFPSGEAYKVGASYPYMRIPRMFMRQTIDLGGEVEKVKSDLNQFAGARTADRLVVTVGKFSVGDVFDTNKFAHDPRSDFMNWSLTDTGTFDYAADAFGYTYGAAVEWYQGPWTLRGGLFDLSIVPNSSDLDPQFGQFQWVGEIERRYTLWGQPGKLAVTGFLTRGRMGRLDDAVRLAELTGEPADIAAVRRYTSRSGISLNLEQQVLPDLGIFARAGFASGDVEPYEFSDIDRTMAAGLALSGKSWGRPDDVFGLAGVVNGISGSHQAFLNAGGLGILVGDGQLPNPGSEKIVEAYYSFPVSIWRVTLDYQFIANPGYNSDRGPVSVIGMRLRSQI